MAWAIDDDDPELWTPEMPFPEIVWDMLEDGALRSLHAHNAQFERLITTHVLTKYIELTPPPEIPAYYCTAALARSRALPGGLDNLARCLGIVEKKDHKGKALIRKCCIVNKKTGDFEYTKQDLDDLYAYCLQDVRVERMAEQQVPPMTPQEHEDWCVNERVNERGLFIDREFCELAQIYGEQEKKELNEELSRLTNGQIPTARSFQKIKHWAEQFAEDDPELQRLMTVVKYDKKANKREAKTVFDKDVRSGVLALAEDDADRFPAIFVEVTKLVHDGGNTSATKLASMLDLAALADDRVRNAYLYAGAGQTLRFASKGAQMHNMLRSCLSPEDYESVKEHMRDNNSLAKWGRVLEVMAKGIRPTIQAPEGCILVSGDWSGIEARIQPWLVGGHDRSSRELLDLFRSGEDIYIDAAAKVFNKPKSNIDPKSDERQIGKVATLSLGFGGAVGAFQGMAKIYGITIEDDDAKVIVDAWRDGNPWATAIWAECEAAANAALRRPDPYGGPVGRVYPAGLLKYFAQTERDGTVSLRCMLPDGTCITYPDARFENKEKFGKMRSVMTCKKASWTPKADATTWPRIDLWGGILFQGAVQATAGCVLRMGMRRLDAAGWPVVGHTHDEIILEVYDDEEEEGEWALAEAMLTPAPWTVGLPLAADIWASTHYGKHSGRQWLPNMLTDTPK